MRLSSALYCLAQFLPAIGWVAALSPISTTKLVNTYITVPRYAPDPDNLYWNTSWDAFAPAAIQYIDQHSFSFVPAATMASLLFNSLATASANASDPRMHQKGDGTSYTYIGRSYGVGASVGLTNMSSPVLSPTSWYSYNESGYQSNVNCAFNRSGTFGLELVAPQEYAALPNLYLATNSDMTTYAVASFLGNNSIVAFGIEDPITHNAIYIAAGTDYAPLNMMQCNVEFSPSTFQVTSNTTSSQIKLDLLGPGSDIDPTASATPNGQHGRLQQKLMWEIIRLSQRNLNLYSSNIGESFKANIERFFGQPWENVTDDQVLAAAATSLEAMIDDILLSFASAQYVLGPRGSQQQVPVVLSVDAIVIGNSNAIYSIFALNMIILTIWMIECKRTRFWKDTLAWDYLDIGDLILATSKGGKTISQTFSILTEKNCSHVEHTGLLGIILRLRKVFSTEASDTLRVRLVKQDEEDALIHDAG